MQQPAPLALCALVLTVPAVTQQMDWPRFRGPASNGVAASATPPTAWSDDTNIRWRAPLPGPGSSSPIVADGKVYVACYSGYGNYLDDGGDKGELVHHIACFAQADGAPLWSTPIPGPLEEAARQMQLNEHGFASPTPAVQGNRVFAYFGRAGVVALTTDGEVLWQTDLGQPDPEAPAASNQVVRNGQALSLKWGAAASPVLHGGLVIVNCSEESNSLRALDQDTGDLVWKHESANLEGSAVSPVVLGEGDDAVLMMVLGGAIWGMDPATGTMLWEVTTETAGGMSSVPVANDDLAYVFGGDDVCYAIRYGRDIEDNGAGDGEDPRIAWKGSKSIAIPSPILYDGKLLAVRSDGFGMCMDPASGEVLKDARLPGRTGGVYASPVVADGRIYVVSRKRGTFVYSADGAFDLIQHNELSDESQFNASPALVGEQLFLRSDSTLYCIANNP